MINGYTMSRQPVPSRENHRDSRAAKVELKIGTAKPRAGKFSTEFSTTRYLTPCKNLTFNESGFIQKRGYVTQHKPSLFYIEKPTPADGKMVGLGERRG